MKWNDGLLDSSAREGHVMKATPSVQDGIRGLGNDTSASHLLFSAVRLSAALAFLHVSLILWMCSLTGRTATEHSCLGNKEGFGSQNNT